MPNLHDGHTVIGRYPVDDDVRLEGEKFACSGLAAGPAGEGKYPQAIAGEQKLAACPLGSDRIVRGTVTDDALKIG
jgi:hypothetical protein